MADEQTQAASQAESAAAAKGGSGLVGKLLGMLLPAVFAGAAGFGGAFLGAPKQVSPEDAQHKLDATKLPGATVDLKPFVLNVIDEKSSDAHHAKVTIAIELAKNIPVEQFNNFVPRVRDACLTYFRNLSFQEIKNPRTATKISEDLLLRIHQLGAEFAVRVLVHEIVVQ
ncbi:MAG: flagellar basal body-associated FliL family protein [Myxococcales bacterium]|nr:flagellar basal body-associated FliL family protein [Myxococcales bacterium]